jgi:hypothetical protein
MAALSYTTIDDPGEAQTSLVAINNSGEIVGGGADNPEGVGGPVHSFVVGVGNFDVGSLDISTATGVNDSGEIVGGYFDGSGHYYLDVGGTVTTLFTGFAGMPGIDDAGDIVGLNAAQQPFIDVGGNISVLSSNAAESIAISANGTIVISYASGSVEGTLSGGFQAVNVPSGDIAQGINDNGQIVGWNPNANGSLGSGFLMDANGTIYQINIPGAAGTRAYGINDSGYIVGTYFDASHNEHGFLTTVSAVEASASETPPAITGVVGQPVNGSPIEVVGTGESGDTVTIYADGGNTPVGTGAVTNGTFDISTTVTFADGYHSLTATQTNAMGVTSTPSGAFTAAVNPNAPIITAVGTNSLNIAPVEVQGLGEAGDTVTLYADGGTTPIGTGTVGGLGTFDINTVIFTGGQHAVMATETDSAGLTSADSANFSFSVPQTATRIGNAGGTYNVVAGANSVITVGNGSDTLNVSGATDSSITLGNGSDTLTLSGGGNNDVTIGNGNDTVTATGESHDTITVGNGNDSVTAGNASIITVGNGTNTLSAGAGSNIVAGKGNDTVIAGNGSIITVGNGADMVTAGNVSTVTVGNGNDTVTTGAGSTVTVGNGNDTVTVGDDFTIIAGSGTDKFVVDSTASPLTGSITGFGAQDTIDLSNVTFGTGTTLALTENSSNTEAMLTVGDGTHTANLTLIGQYVAAQFSLTTDGQGGTLITDPPTVAMTDHNPIAIATPHHA